VNFYTTYAAISLRKMTLLHCVGLFILKHEENYLGLELKYILIYYQNEWKPQILLFSTGDWFSMSVVHRRNLFHQSCHCRDVE
jgi:hypothetical protein